MKKTFVFAFAGLVLGVQNISADELWKDVQQRDANSGFAQRIVTTDMSALTNALADAPLEFKGGSTTHHITLPMPNGENQRFRVEESPILEPALAQQYPNVKTYRVFGVDEPTSSGRIGIVDGVFHGLLHTENGSVWIDTTGSSTSYRSFYKRDYAIAHRGNSEPFSCGVEPDPYADQSPVAGFRSLARTDGPRRNYRIAVAATGEYTAFHGGTVGTGLAAITAAINRVNQIYNRDLNVHMTLVANNNLLIYTNAGTDPYTNSNGFTMLGQNQANIDAVIGTANYDIGHVFSTGGGGVAGLGVVCNAGAKARGVTGGASPTGDPFWIDFVAHEIGHQFAGNHTFNGTTGNCVGGNRNASTAYEPGSGTTIMAYAGICSAENVQSNSDATFHAGSIAEMGTFIATGGGSVCGTTAGAPNAGNTAPTVNAGNDFTIPGGTPFVLTGSATDGDVPADTLTYQWDQLDAGTATDSTSYGTDLTDNALFRSFLPSSSASRTLPRMSTLIANTTDKSETLPTASSALDFRLTVRDQNGGVDADDMRVIVNTTVGPFRIRQPNAAGTLDTSQVQVFEWGVANTEGGNINCATVNIDVTTDGGANFTTLLAATPNDGSANVTITPSTAAAARFRIACVGNIFFDLSDANVALANGSGTVLTASTNTAPNVNAGADQSVTAGATVNLLATVSDPNLDSYSVAWTETTSTGVTINNANTATPAFTAPSTQSTVTVQLTATDNRGAASSDSVTITVGTPITTIGGGGGGGGAINLAVILILLWGCMIRTRRHPL